MEPNQLNLFSKLEINRTSVHKQNTLVMDADTLSKWKSQIFAHQQRARESKQTLQTTLFDITPTHADLDADAIDPFSLPLHSISFYRLPANTSGEACIYFVIDNATQLLLYVGETCRSNVRWKGTHDCKRYIENYQSLHYQYGLKTAVSIAFCWDAPAQTQPRQQLEQTLIQKWRSPFNKENWVFWGASFV